MNRSALLTFALLCLAVLAACAPAAAPTATFVPPTATPVPPTVTPVPPTATAVPPAATPNPPTATATGTATPTATATPPPTATPTNTRVPPTNTPRPPTNTPVPPTNTPRPTVANPYAIPPGKSALLVRNYIGRVVNFNIADREFKVPAQLGPGVPGETFIILDPGKYTWTANVIAGDTSGEITMEKDRGYLLSLRQ